MPDDVPEAAQLPADAQDSALDDAAVDESAISDVATADTFAATVNFEAETAVTADEADWEFEEVDLLEQILEQEPPEELLVSLERFESMVENELAEVDEETLADELGAVAIGLERAARQTASASATLHEQRLDQDLARREAAQLNAEDRGRYDRLRIRLERRGCPSRSPRSSPGCSSGNSNERKPRNERSSKTPGEQ